MDDERRIPGMDTDIRDEIDRSFGDGPPVDHATRSVELGRRALRRRRVAAGTAGVAAAVVLGSVAWAIPQGSGTSTPPVTSSPTRHPTPTTVEPTTPPEFFLHDLPATFDPQDGSLIVRPGWRVLDRVEKPFTVAPLSASGVPAKSLGVVATNGSETQWLLMAWWPGDGGTSSTYNDPAGHGFESFESWLDIQVARETGTWTRELVTRGATGTLTPLNGVAVTQQRAALELGDGYAVARLQVLDDEWWIVTRPAGSATESLVVPYPLESAPATLTGFVDHIRDEGILDGHS